MHAIVRSWARVLAAGLLVPAALAGPAAAHVPLGTQSARPPGILSVDSGTKVDANRISMFVTNVGSFAYDMGTGNAGLEFPKGSTNTAVFAAGLWMGAKVAGQTRVTVAEYSNEYSPGPMSGGTFLPDNPAFKVYKVSREDTTGWGDWIGQGGLLGAPVDSFKVPDPTTPDPTDSVWAYQPHITGDQTLWGIFNDADPSVHTNRSGQSAPLGVEVELTAFAFNRQGALGNTVFLSYKIRNKGANQLDSTYVSIWSDPDLGGAGDDLVGVDVPLSLGYCYNATNNDNLYGNRPPAVGYDFFKGPLSDNGDTLGLTSFNKYVNGTDPSSREQSYNYMKGLNPDGTPVIDPTTNQVTTFFHSGDPVARTGWLDTNPADRRLMLSAGPFTMHPGDEQTVVAAVLVGDGRDRLSSVRALKFYDQFAQDAFDKNFDLPNPPSTPLVESQALDRKVVLTWDVGSQQNVEGSPYEFQGYNLYQGETASGPWKRIATYDIVDGVGTIQDEVFDPEFGDVVVIPVQFGEDAGVRHQVELTEDFVRGGPLNNGTRYYYAVTAYSYAPDGKPKTLENSQGTAGRNVNAVIVMPQKPTAGTDLSPVDGGVVLQTRADTNIPATTDQVEVTVVDPTKVTGCEYKVYYTPTEDPHPVYNGQDVVYYWNLMRICGTDSSDVLTNQLNKTGDEDYVVVDGLLVKVSGAYKPELQSVVYVKTDPDNARDLQPIVGGASERPGCDAWYSCASGYGFDFFDSSLDPDTNPNAFTSVEIRFDSTATQKAYRFFRDEVPPLGGAPSTGRGYTYGGFQDCRFQVWDTVNNRQLDACFVERRFTDASGAPLPQDQQPASNDATWGPTTDDGDGGREYLWIMGSTYTPTPKPEYEVDGDPIGAGAGTSGPNMYALWVYALDSDNPYPDNGEKMVWTWANPGTSNDFFRFQSTPPVKDNPQLAKQQLAAIRVVPNPYYGRSLYETNQYNRQVRFMNLPATCTIRIFNLSGDLVRTLQKTNDGTSVFTWDVQTDNGLPVGSGIYLYQVDAPGVGATVGRMAVFMEKERLNNY